MSDPNATCPGCGHPYRGTPARCLYCGRDLARAEAGGGLAAPAPPAATGPRSCPQCGRKAGARSERCLYCGASLEVPTGLPARRCPRCATALATEEAGWVLVDGCPACGGTFYDAGEMEQAEGLAPKQKKWLESNLERHPHDAPGGQPLPCPGCAGPMDTLRVKLAYREVVLDRCPRCKGLWLDAGEAETLALLVKEHVEPPKRMWHEVDTQRMGRGRGGLRVTHGVSVLSRYL